jgi:ribonuclease P protein component
MEKLTKKQILQKSEDISRVLQSRKVSKKHLSFYKSSSMEPLENTSRLGLAIPKKNAKRAIDRNRIKRVIREAFRKSTNPKSFDLVVKLHAPIGIKTKKRLREPERRLIQTQVQEFFYD